MNKNELSNIKNSNCIKFVNIVKKYSDLTALSNINLTINKGEVFGLVGPSGAGKSTLLRTINKLEEVDSGDIFVNNYKINDLKGKDLASYRQKVAMIFQHFTLLQTQNVYKNIALPLEVKHIKKEKVKERVLYLAKLVGLEEKLDSLPNTLSGGQSQRVAIARALALEPEILLCDEATSALDPNTTIQILDILKKINKELGITIVLVTHQMEVVKYICNRVAIINKGKIIETGNTEDIFLYKNKALDTLINEKPVLPATGKNIKLIFPKKSASDSLITKMARELNIDFDIAWGKLEKFGDDVLGSLVINVSDKDFQKVLDYVSKTDVKYEVMEG